MVLALEIHPDAAADLAVIRRENPEAFGRISALLQQMKLDLSLNDRLLQHGIWEEDIDVKYWVEQKRHNIWRLKVLTLTDAAAAYRIVYAFFGIGLGVSKPFIRVVAIIKRHGFNYEYDHPITQRILKNLDPY